MLLSDVKSGRLMMEIRVLQRNTAIVAICLALPGCASTGLPTGEQAYEIIPAPSTQTAPSAYRIGPPDVLKITVFQEPDLSLRSEEQTSGLQALMRTSYAAFRLE